MAAYRDDPADPYLYEGTGVLRNILGIRDAAKLQAFETAATIARDAEISSSPLPEKFSFEHLKAIHGHIFQDVYVWAGKVRKVDMSKDGSFFAHHRMIESYGSKVLGPVDRERKEWIADPRGSDIPARLAYFLGEINALHPFREGNGRTQRIFIGQLAETVGRRIRWELIAQKRMIRVSKASFSGDNGPLVAMMREIVVR